MSLTSLQNRSTPNASWVLALSQVFDGKFEYPMLNPSAEGSSETGGSGRSVLPITPACELAPSAKASTRRFERGDSGFQPRKAGERLRCTKKNFPRERPHLRISLLRLLSWQRSCSIDIEESTGGWTAIHLRPPTSSCLSHTTSSSPEANDYSAIQSPALVNILSEDT